ncbi:MAG: shikimate dehydrogenase [Clostridiales bacterium]|nr:shikimate dehydrogenase [Clostridiales bacterium]
MKKLAIIGSPVSHSHSPAMHNFISQKIGADFNYSAIEVPPENLGQAVAALKDAGYAGFNVTAPHKQEIMQYLDEISRDAQIFGAVNTVVNRNGRLFGYNTDAEGFYMSLLHGGINPYGADILIFGAGGAACPVIMYLASHGAKSVTVINRRRERALDIARRTKELFGADIETEITKPRYDIVINCTTLGMEQNAGLSPMTDLSVIDRSSSAVDMIYNPPETLFLKQAKTHGAKTMNGLGMLVFQGILAYELFTGTKLPQDMADMIFREVFNL